MCWGGRVNKPTTEEVCHGALREEQYAITAPNTQERISLAGYEPIIFEYYEACEKTQTILDRLEITSDGNSGAGEMIFIPEMYFQGRAMVADYYPDRATAP